MAPAAHFDQSHDPVWITDLRLTRFRNYDTANLSAGPGPVVLVGDNGAGKTNLIEALSFLSPGRGLRRAVYGDVGQTGSGGDWAVAATVTDPRDSHLVGTGLQITEAGLDRSRRIRIDGTAVQRSEDLLDHIRVLWLTPSMDGLFTGPASDRRRFLDRFVLAIDRDHASRVNAFEKAMRGRNRLLEDHQSQSSWIDAIEQQMAELAVAVAAARRELVDSLNAVIADAQTDRQAFPSAGLALEGELESLIGSQTAVEVEDAYIALLRQGRHADQAAGRTLKGPHRSDLTVQHMGKSMAASQCSTGEQKALLIGLVLAQTALVAKMSGRTPVVLLDEVAAHLDRHRRAGLFAELARLGCQAWMTGTEWAPFADLGEAAQVYAIDNGQIATLTPE